MSIGASIGTFLGRSSLIAATSFLGVTILLVSTIWMTSIDTVDQWLTVQAKSEQLEQLRLKSVRVVKSGDVPSGGGTPFLEGTTLTIAGATLLQRVNSAISGVGGSVQSSQVDLLSGGKDGTVSLLVNCEVDQLSLQKLLFQLETENPILFVDQLDIQVPQLAANDSRQPTLRVALNVSGRWQAPK